jgi:sugar/nucleoside kinase (ribokinase family)
MVSWVGDDADGQLVLADLQHFGVDTTHVVVQPDTATNTTAILIDSSGEKAIIIVPTSFDVLSFTPALIAYLSNSRLVYTPPYDVDQLERVADVVHAAGGLVCTDIEPIAELAETALRQVLACVDIAFVKADALPTSDYDQAAQNLRAWGADVIVITCGEKGALACDAQGVIKIPAFTVPVVDTTGAGDCFAASFLAAYLRQLPLTQTLRYASAAAALAVQGYGARGALPSDEQIQLFLAAQG